MERSVSEKKIKYRKHQIFRSQTKKFEAQKTSVEHEITLILIKREPKNVTCILTDMTEQAIVKLCCMCRSMLR